MPCGCKALVLLYSRFSSKRRRPSCASNFLEGPSYGRSDHKRGGAYKYRLVSTSSVPSPMKCTVCMARLEVSVDITRVDMYIVQQKNDLIFESQFLVQKIIRNSDWISSPANQSSMQQFVVTWRARSVSFIIQLSAINFLRE